MVAHPPPFAGEKARDLAAPFLGESEDPSPPLSVRDAPSGASLLGVYRCAEIVITDASQQRSHGTPLERTVSVALSKINDYRIYIGNADRPVVVFWAD